MLVRFKTFKLDCNWDIFTCCAIQKKSMFRAFNLFISNNFFRKTNASEILHYYSNELLSKLYPLLSNKEQKEINQAILSTKTLFYHWTYKDDYSEKKVYSNYLKTTYELVSMLPLTFLNEYKELKKYIKKDTGNTTKQKTLHHKKLPCTLVGKHMGIMLMKKCP